MTIRATTEVVATTSSEAASAGRSEPGRPAKLLADLFEAHAPLVLGICRGMLRDPHDAEDAAQQTFLSAYANLLGGTEPREPAPWLATIARNECRSRAQRRMREPLPEFSPEAERSDPAFRAAQAADVESLRLALAQLPRQQRKAFLLREFTGLSYNELALALGVTQPAVESLLFRARQQLRVSLRAAVAVAISLPGSLRDFFTQLAGGSPDGPTTLAKLGSAPLVAKLAAGTAGAAFVTAGAVAVLPARHPRATAQSAPAPAHSAPARHHRNADSQPVPTTGRERLLATAGAGATESEHRALSQHRVRSEPRTVASQAPRTESNDHSSGLTDRSPGTSPAELVSNDSSGSGDTVSQPNPPETSVDASHTSAASALDGSDPLGVAAGSQPSD